MTTPVQDRGFHLFVYGTLRAEGAAHALLDGARRVAVASIRGTLYDIDGQYPALMLYGTQVVNGEVWHVPDAARLARLDAYEGVAEGLFRRVGLDVDGFGCWVYVAGPAVARKLVKSGGQ